MTYPIDSTAHNELRYTEEDSDIVSAGVIAEAFHEVYELLAPRFGYKTREASAKRWADVPADNRALMTATVDTLISRGVIKAGPKC